MIKATAKKQNETPLIDEKTYPARIISLIHIGSVAGYQGSIQDKVRITFELPTVRMVFDQAKGEQARVISQEYTNSCSEKATLRELIKACGVEIEIDEVGVETANIELLVGKACLVSIEQKTKKDGTGKYNNIKSTMALMDGQVVPEAENETFIFDVDDFNAEQFQEFPEFLQNKIKDSVQYKEMMGIVEDPTA